MPSSPALGLDDHVVGIGKGAQVAARGADADLAAPLGEEHRATGREGDVPRSTTGYLRRQLPAAPADANEHDLPSEPYLLVTTGGGGDGEGLIDWVLKAYETTPDLPHPALLVFGPFMDQEQRIAFQERAAKLPKVHAITFESQFEKLLERAIGVVAMGGYNTFCEILSFGKPALIVPRTRPRREQLLRARRAEVSGFGQSPAGQGSA